MYRYPVATTKISGGTGKYIALEYLCPVVPYFFFFNSSQVNLSLQLLVLNLTMAF